MAIFDFLRRWAKEEQEVKQRKREVDDALGKIIVFPGNKQEFEEFMGYEVRIIDTGRHNQGLIYQVDGDQPFDHYSPEFREKLVNCGIVGIINATPICHYFRGSDDAKYGLPVARKEKN